MKRDWDVIRSILLKVEEGTGEKEVSSPDLKPMDEALVAYNMWLLIESGMVEGGGREPGSGPPHAFVHRLRWPGHELLDSIRGDTVWNRIKATARDKGVDLTLDAIKAIAKIVLEGLLRG
jgi:hypothetical protein